jgi:type I restriction enzyme R subunit
MTKIQKRQVYQSYEIHLSLYQVVKGSEEEQNIYLQFSPHFFDLIVVGECHRGSAADDSNWREILGYDSKEGRAARNFYVSRIHISIFNNHIF